MVLLKFLVYFFEILLFRPRIILLNVLGLFLRGFGIFPPPSNDGIDIVWCGLLNGLFVINPVSAGTGTITVTYNGLTTTVNVEIVNS